MLQKSISLTNLKHRSNWPSSKNKLPHIPRILRNRISEISTHIWQKTLASSQPASYPWKWLKADTQIDWFTLIYFTQIPFIS